MRKKLSKKSAKLDEKYVFQSNFAGRFEFLKSTKNSRRNILTPFCTKKTQYTNITFIFSFYFVWTKHEGSELIVLYKVIVNLWFGIENALK